MKKNNITLTIIIIICLLALSACTKDINYIVDNEPCVKGIVSEISDDYIIMDVNEDDELYRSYTSIMVSLDVKRKDSPTDFNIGDEVAVYYNGNILETHPAKIKTVYAILYIGDPK